MHTHTITKRVAGSGAQEGGEVLIEKASSFLSLLLRRGSTIR